VEEPDEPRHADAVDVVDRREGTTAVAITMTMPPIRVAASDPSDEMRVTAITITKTGKITARMGGAMIRAPPVAGATPRPPWKPMNGERL